MPVIIVKCRKGVLATSAQKAQCIDGVAEAFARAAGDPARKALTTVIIEEVSDDDWGRGGRQVSSIESSSA